MVSRSSRSSGRARATSVVDLALTALENLAHRGAFGADPETGDGAGITVQMPDRFFREIAGATLPPVGSYASRDRLSAQGRGRRRGAEGRDRARRRRRGPGRAFVAGGPGRAGRRRRDGGCDGPELLAGLPRSDPAGSRPGFRAWRSSGAFRASQARRARRRRVYFPSLSARTIVYKGMLTSEQLRRFFPDLRDPTLRVAPRAGALALLDEHVPELAAGPSVPLRGAQRRDQHRAGQPQLDARPRGAAARPTLIAGDLDRLFPICTPGASDSARFDEVLELLHLGGRSPAPRRADDDPRGLGEPHHDGPRRAGPSTATTPRSWSRGTARRRRLHRRHGRRRGARPQRPAPGALLGHRRRPGGAGQRGRRARHRARRRVVRKGRLQPGRMFLVDTAQGRIVDDEEIKAELAAEHPYGEWLGQDQVRLDELPRRAPCSRPSTARVVAQQRLFGYTDEELSVILAPDGPHRRRADRLDGLGHADRRALGPLPAALRLLHPALRPGDQPAAGRHPRGAGDLAAGHHRARGQPARGHAAARAARSCCRCRSSTATTWPS